MAACLCGLWRWRLLIPAAYCFCSAPSFSSPPPPPPPPRVQRLVDKWGTEIEAKLNHRHAVRYLAQCEGIGASKAASIKRAWDGTKGGWVGGFRAEGLRAGMLAGGRRQWCR